MVYTRTAARVLAKNVLHHLRFLQAKNAFLSIFPVRRISASAKVGVLSLFIFHFLGPILGPNIRTKSSKAKKVCRSKEKAFQTYANLPLAGF